MSTTQKVYRGTKDATGRPVAERAAQNADGTWTIGGTVAGTQALTDSATISWDASLGPVAIVTLGGNRTLANPTNLTAGMTYTVVVHQDATGNRTLAYGNLYTWPAGTPPTLSTGANAIDVVTLVYDGTHLYGSALKAYA